MNFAVKNNGNYNHSCILSRKQANTTTKRRYLCVGSGVMKFEGVLLAIASTAAIFCTGIQSMNAQEAESSHDARQQDTHVHGVVEMNIAIEGDRLYLELLSPAANIVGFERSPNSIEQEAAIADALKILEWGEELFGLLDSAECSFADITMESDIDSEHSEEEHASQAREVHSEFVPNYEISCSNPEQLNQIEVMLFAAFLGVEEIEVQALTIGPNPSWLFCRG